MNKINLKPINDKLNEIANNLKQLEKLVKEI